MTEISQEAVKRFNPHVRTYCGEVTAGMEAAEDGQWISVDDLPAIQAQVHQRVIGDLVDGYVADPSDLCPPIVESLDAIKAELQAQVLAGVKELENEIRRKAANTSIPSPPLEEGKADGLEQAANLIRKFLATLNPNEGEGQHGDA